jgi:zinc finger SWIM domain-containing protein 3
LTYEVKSLESNKEYAVDLANSTCTCFTFQSQGYPCIHAVKVILFRRENIANYVQDWFKVPAYRKTYENGILPPAAAIDLETLPIFEDPDIELTLDGHSDIIIAGSGDGRFPLLPPNTRRPAGRPKKRRIRHPSEWEPQREFKCTRCKGVGHNTRTCKEPLIVVQPDQALEHL